MYVGDGHNAPQPNALQDAELRHAIRRLAHHPSIALWNSCNECYGGGTYDSFVATTIASEDVSRPVWPASPSFGWDSGVDTLTGLPNGQRLNSRQQQSPGRAGRRGIFNEVGFESASASLISSWASPCSCAAGNCTYFSNADYDQGFNGKTVGASTAQECCDACAGDPTDCYAASWSQSMKMCWFKPKGGKFTMATGVTSVFPPGSVPPPLPLRQIEVS